MMSKIDVGGAGRVVRFHAKDGVGLAGLLFGDRRAKNCIIFVHGLGGSFNSNLAFHFGSLHSKDFAFFTFGNRGHDVVSRFAKISGGRRKTVKAGTTLEKFEECEYDIGGAIGALRKLGFRSFVLCGHSTGCQKSVYYQYKTRDRGIRALVLLAPADDYNIARRDLGEDFGRTAKMCKKMIASGRGDSIIQNSYGFSARRLDSIINKKRVEARLFDYDGALREFASIKTPIFAVFGSKEEYAIKPVDQYLGILESKTRSRRFGGLVIKNANHSFQGCEEDLVRSVESWLR